MLSRRVLNVAVVRTSGGHFGALFCRCFSSSTLVVNHASFLQTPPPLTSVCIAPLLSSRYFSTQFPGTFYLNKHDPDDIQRELSNVDEWLAEADKVPFGKRGRGISQVKRRMNELETARRNKQYDAPRQKAAKLLYKLIYRRHALQHGAWSLKHLTNLELGKTFFGEESTQKIKHKEAEFIIRQRWKFGYSDYFDVKYLGKEPEKGSKMTIQVANKIKQQL